MTSSETSRGDEDRPSLAVDRQPESALEAKRKLQRIVYDLARYGPSRSATELAQRLEAAIAEAGLPEQPARWVESVAIEAAGGRVTVIDARFEQD